MLAPAAPTGRRTEAAMAARKMTAGRMLGFGFIWFPLLPREHGPGRKVTGNESVRAPTRGNGLERGAEDGLRVVAVHPGDEVVGDQLGAGRAALVLVRAPAEPEPVHRPHHREHAALALGLSLGQ